MGIKKKIMLFSVMLLVILVACGKEENQHPEIQDVTETDNGKKENPGEKQIVANQRRG